jgi:tetrapyrrole methylase family protein/MazG family protein
MKNKEMISDNFIKLYEIISNLRGPNGCAWDKKQTAHSLRSSLLEETFECIDAIQEQDNDNLKEELGDMFLVILMISKIKEQEEAFYLDEIIQGITEKIVRRHPHVFGNEKDKTVSGIIKKWEEIKESEEGKYNRENFMDNVPKTIPPLERANVIQKYASKVGFDWKEPMPVIDKIKEELDELIEEVIPPDNSEINMKNIELEVGDLIFTIVNLCRILKIDPSLALNSTNNKFISRFNKLEKVVKVDKKNLNEVDLNTMDGIWNKIKAEEK